jgi:hypothetical protein
MPPLPLYIPNAPTHLTLLIQSAVLIVNFPTIQSPAVNCFPDPLSHKYLPQHSILGQPQFIFLPQYKEANFISRYKEANYIYLYIYVYFFLTII